MSNGLGKSIRSLRTTVVGFLGGLVIVGSQLIAVLDSDPETVFNMTILIAGLTAMGLGIFAKDGDKSTEDVQ